MIITIDTARQTYHIEKSFSEESLRISSLSINLEIEPSKSRYGNLSVIANHGLEKSKQPSIETIESFFAGGQKVSEVIVDAAP